MRKFTSILKVITFINLEIFILCGLLVMSIMYGHKYLQNSAESVSGITLSLRQSEFEKIENSRKIDKFNELDNLLLNQSLKNLDINDNLDLLMSYKDSFQLSSEDFERFDSLLIEKSIMFRVIKTFKKSTEIAVSKNDFVKSNTSLEIVPKKTITSKKNLFGRTKSDTLITYDTIRRENKIFDSESFKNTKSLSEKVDYNSFQNYIFKNNLLTLEMRTILNKTII